MRGTGKLVVFGAAALLSLLLSAAGVYERAEELNRQRVEAGRMRNVVLLTPEERGPEEASPAPVSTAKWTSPPAGCTHKSLAPWNTGIPSSMVINWIMA